MSKSVGTGPSSYEKRIYRAAVSQRLRNTAVYSSIIVSRGLLCPLSDAIFYSYLQRLRNTAVYSSIIVSRGLLCPLSDAIFYSYLQRLRNTAVYSSIIVSRGLLCPLSDAIFYSYLTNLRAFARSVELWCEEVQFMCTWLAAGTTDRQK